MSGKVRTTAGRGRLFDSMLDTIGDTPCIRVNNLGPEDVRRSTPRPRSSIPAASVKDRLARQHHRGGRAQRRAEARPDRGRGDQRQYRHRARHGLRPEGLSAGRDHGRQLLDRAPQADAHAGRQGGADAARRRRASACTRRRSSWPRPTAGSLPTSSRPTANADIHEATTAREIIGRLRGRAARLFRHRLWHRRHRGRRRRACCATNGRRPRSCCASRPTPSSSAAARRRSAPPTARPPPATRLRAASDPGLDPGLHPAACCRRRSTSKYYRRVACRSPAPRA